MSRELDDTVGADRSALLPGELAPGRTFADRYTVEALLGRGGMGAVYRVRDEKLDEVVALKLLTLDTKRSVERFLREVRLARRVTHPNVVRTHDLGEQGGVHFLTMEYVRGTALDRVLDERGTLGPERATEIGAAIAAGLEAAHAAGVIHRDLKPANVLIAEDGRVVLTDFGIARATQTDTRTHETGALVGTPHYMAPEQVSGRDVDARVDLYALGLILYELVTGTLPFEADNPIAVAVMRLHQAPEDPRRRAAVPDALADLILRCLAREPDARPRGAAEVRVALGGSPTSTPPRMTPPATPSGMSLYAPMARNVEDTLAVLPFTYRGPAEHAYLGEGLAEELIDVLARTRGLKVLALGATRRFGEGRDPGRVRDELGATALVDGTVQLANGRLRLAARLIDTEAGVQTWTERFDGDLEDVFGLQESMARRVAEGLRLEVQSGSFRNRVPEEAVRRYLQARARIHADAMTHGEEVVAHLEEALAIAPEFPLAIAAHAIASVRAWWGKQDVGAQRGERARQSVARAEEQAPDLAETHLARAMLSVQNGAFREAAQSLGRALDITPTLPEAHQYLGELQTEAGRMREGMERLKLALELDPTLHNVRYSLTRMLAMTGDPGAEAREQELVQLAGADTIPLLVSRFRWALYRADDQRARAVMARIAGLPGNPVDHLVVLARVAFDPSARDAALARTEHFPGWLENPRFTSLMLQISTEAFAYGALHDDALELLGRAAAGTLIDVEWMDRCTVLAPLRADPRFAAARAQVAERAASIWRR